MPKSMLARFDDGELFEIIIINGDLYREKIAEALYTEQFC